LSLEIRHNHLGHRLGRLVTMQKVSGTWAG
jgi:hypothetical protein